jgi:hypothetical protein
MSKKNRLKLPKKLLGVEIPKTSRKQVDKLLKNLPADSAKPLLGAAVAALVTALAARLEQPLTDLIESYADPGKARRGKAKTAPPTAH